MDLKDDNKIFGLPHYLYQGQHDRTDELNHRILERNVSDNPLAPNFTPRPALTRYALFPMLDSRMPSNVPISPNYDYSLAKNFTPPVMNTGPVSGFINNIQEESHLRNQIYPLCKGDDANTYIPSTESDLYKVYVTASKSNQPYPGLFEQASFSQELHPNIRNSTNIGGDRFHNNTRTQLRNINSAK